MRKKIKFMVATIGLLVLCVALISIYKRQDVMDELYALDSEVTMMELTKEGYIDVSKAMSSQNKEISVFLTKARNKKEAILRIVNTIDGKLCAKILMYDKKYDVIKMWTVYPNQQQAESPGKCFSTRIYVVEADGVIDVFLKNVRDESLPVNQEFEAIDEKLYSYLNFEAR